MRIFVYFYRNCHRMNNELQIADEFLAPLFDELYNVKEKDFSIQYNSLGSGDHKLLLLVDAQGVDYLADAEFELLKSIIDKGLRKKLDDAWILNLSNYKTATLQDLIDYFKPFQIIAWGCEDWMRKEGIKLETHQQGLIKSVDFLRAGELKTYLTDNVMKGRLWASLQKMFFN